MDITSGTMGWLSVTSSWKSAKFLGVWRCMCPCSEVTYRFNLVMKSFAIKLKGRNDHKFMSQKYKPLCQLQSCISNDLQWVWHTTCYNAHVLLAVNRLSQQTFSNKKWWKEARGGGQKCAALLFWNHSGNIAPPCHGVRLWDYGGWGLHLPLIFLRSNFFFMAVSWPSLWTDYIFGLLEMDTAF